MNTDIVGVRTSTMAKNRHLNIVLQAELYLRTGTYDRPKNTLAIDSACAPLDSALAIDAVAPTLQLLTISLAKPFLSNTT